METMKRILTREYAIAAEKGGQWNLKIAKFSFFIPVWILGASWQICNSTPDQNVSIRLSYGSDPSKDKETRDCLFYLAKSSVQFLPSGFGFKVDEDKPVYVDAFPREGGQGGHLIIYFVPVRIRGS